MAISSLPRRNAPRNADSIRLSTSWNFVSDDCSKPKLNAFWSKSCPIRYIASLLIAKAAPSRMYSELSVKLAL